MLTLVGLSSPPDVSPKTVGRFWSRVDLSGECWLWTGPKTRYGYGHFYVFGGDQLALGLSGYNALSHRVAYALWYGPCPTGLCVMHACDTKLCCRPAHLYAGTNDENVRDACKSGLMVTGAANHASRLTEQLVIEMRALRAQGASYKSLGRRFGVSGFTASAACRGETWAHVPEGIERRKKGAARKLTLDDVARIKALVASGVRRVDVAAEYGIHRTSVGNVLAGRRWGAQC